MQNSESLILGLLRRLTLSVSQTAALLVLVLALALPPPARAVPDKGLPVGGQLRPLIEADWLQREGAGLPQTREAIQRGLKLAARLQPKADASRLAPLAARLRELAARTEALPASAPPAEVRALFLETRRIVREVAFCNPLLREINHLLFITRHDSVGVFHMVDQFYGFYAKPGGRLLALTEPFGPQPGLVNLLAGATVQQGRLKGRKLEGGAFLSPEISFDGKTILFAWTEGKGKELEWSPTASHHIFKVNSDGRGLTQLTDGPWNDFDPCFLPGGRITFVSERRGGFLRCGRHCPTYTLHGMAVDGSDVICLSFHETHEWQPSITHDGMIIYTRWDYVDRDTNIAHHPWTCRPDGTDPRAIHGNYPQVRERRPWMEMDLRAIPGSQKFVATAGAHHGHAFGSLVILDPRVPDDGAESQLTRLTPEVPYPEAETPKDGIRPVMIYGTPWPLSEDDFLCVYDPSVTNRGIYWMDRFGNKELIYRDPAISCVSPMPLQARPLPPVIPDSTTQTAAAQAGSDAKRPATIAVMNVYDSDFKWPADTKITALRIIQVLPKSTPAPNVPRIGIADQTNARGVLGTVPVEADGSAYFEAPVEKAVYFQALDAGGLAVQSMRSATYVHKGEQMTCVGCHEQRHEAPRVRLTQPLAMRRAPSPIKPEVAGANPFSFVRLVQPVLDRNCVSCHQGKQTPDLRGIVEGKLGWTRSYQNLAAKYGFYFSVGNGSIKDPVHGGARSIAGRFGARASALLRYLDSPHQGVTLSAEDRHRLVLWLDCNSEFYGSYENIAAQSRGEIVLPSLQ
ncbi:MAG: hypothetical protein WCS99_02130 [Limisphaerales bacterium]